MSLQKKWEYKIEEECNVVSMNKLGAEGWELCAVVNNGGYGTYYFKRQMPFDYATAGIKEFPEKVNI